jgi:hypothetical protein
LEADLVAHLVTLSEDGPLGKEGDQVWVDDPAQTQAKPPKGKPAAPPDPAAKGTGKSTKPQPE